MDLEWLEKLKDIAVHVCRKLNHILPNYLEDIVEVRVNPVWNTIEVSMKHMKVVVLIGKGYKEVQAEFKTRTVITKTVLELLNRVFETVEKAVNEKLNSLNQQVPG